MRLTCLIPLLFPALAMAEPVQIPGPEGPLEAEQITVEGAEHAVVIIPGSGPTNRDGNAPQMGLSSDSYKLLAEGLADHGIPYKRGFFGSAKAIADPNSATITAYAEDARAWVTHAAALAPCVWIAGHSEGGLVALLAAQTPPNNLCGLILLATSGRPTGQLMIEQFEANPMNAPLMPEIKSLVSELEAGRTRDPATISPALQPLFSLGLQRYMINLFSHDPATLAKGWQSPALIVQGDADIQVRPHDADLLEAAMPQAQRVTLTGGTHMLKADIAGNPFATYANPDLPLHKALLPAVTAFILATPTSD